MLAGITSLWGLREQGMFARVPLSWIAEGARVR
jgi:hypothetical protein